MSVTNVTIGADLSPLTDNLTSAAKALSDFASGPVADAGKSIEDAVNGSFDAVARTIANAAVSGKTSVDQMVDAILADFDRVAIKDFIAKPIEGIVSSFADSVLGVSGGRALGGPVAMDSTYLVGEQGPELFSPSSNGTIVPNGALGGGGPSVVLNVQVRDAPSFLKSESQISAMMARALARGQKNL
jgi:phage-related minor tail protein